VLAGHDGQMWILDFLAPQSCVFCGLTSEGDERSICEGCYEDLPWNEPRLSPTPGIFVSSIAVVHYSFPVDAAIKAFKFSRKLYYAPAFAELLCSSAELLPSDIDAVLPVPLHWRREATRGFNQASEIAKPVADFLGLPVLHGVRRQKATPFQSGLAAKDRARNLRDAFATKRGMSQRHVLIIDDVVTTGATMRALAKVLMKNGVSKVSCLAVARAG
jgi:ComF family protein